MFVDGKDKKWYKDYAKAVALKFARIVTVPTSVRKENRTNKLASS
jgi:hypothetical protein